MPNLTHWFHGRHVAATCHALQSSAETHPLIIDTILKDAAAGLLDSYSMESVSGTDQLVITFKYKTDTTSQTLENGDWFVILESGIKTAFTDAEFRGTYKEYEGFFADCSHTDCDTLAQ